MRTTGHLPEKSAFGDLMIEVAQNTPGVIRLRWKGKSNHVRPDAVLSPFFADLTSKAVMSRSRIEMHFEDLEFFNSSTITAIIKYVKELRDRQVALAISYSSSHKWQRIFFDALWVFVKSDGLFTMNAVKK